MAFVKKAGRSSPCFPKKEGSPGVLGTPYLSRSFGFRLEPCAMRQMQDYNSRGLCLRTDTDARASALSKDRYGVPRTSSDLAKSSTLAILAAEEPDPNLPPSLSLEMECG